MAATEDAAARPICECHGEPQIKDGFRENGRQAWQCRVTERARQAALYSDSAHAEKKRAEMRNSSARSKRRERYWERKARGVCTKCQGPLLSATLCWDCLNEQEERYALRITGG